MVAAAALVLDRPHGRPTEYYKVLDDLRHGRKLDPRVVDPLRAWVESNPGYYHRASMQGLYEALQHAYRPYGIEYVRWTSQGKARIDQATGQKRSLTGDEECEELGRALTEAAARWPRHRLSITSKYDSDYLGQPWKVAPRFQNYLQLNEETRLDTAGRPLLWTLQNRGFKCFRSNAGGRETIEDAVRRVEREVNDWFALPENRDKQYASIAVNYRQPLNAWRALTDAEAGHVIVVTIHWEKTGHVTPEYVKRQLRFLIVPKIGQAIVKPGDYEFAEQAINEQLRENKYQKVLGWTADFQQGHRPGDLNSARSDHWLCGVVTEEDTKHLELAPEYHVAVMADYGERGMYYPDLNWMVKGPNESLRKFAEWDVATLTHVVEHKALIELADQFTARGVTTILYRKPVGQPARDPRQPRYCMAIVHGSAPNNAWNGPTIGKANSVDFHLKMNSSEFHDWELLVSKCRHTFVRFLPPNDITDIHLGLAILQQKWPKQLAEASFRRGQSNYRGGSSHNPW